MAGFALAASATPGPVNIIGAMTSARYGTAQALAFVTGATASFLVLFLAFVLPLADRASGLAVFAMLFGVICWASLAVWVWGGARVQHRHMRVFNRVMAVALVISVCWILMISMP